jgi:hypothetical protein
MLVPTEAPVSPPALQSPRDGDTAYPDATITFSWEWPGQAQGDDQRFVLEMLSEEQTVHTDTTQEMSLDLSWLGTGLGVGGYQWVVWVEKRVEEVWEKASPPSETGTFRIIPWPTAVPTSPPTSVPPSRG